MRTKHLLLRLRPCNVAVVSLLVSNIAYAGDDAGAGNGATLDKAGEASQVAEVQFNDLFLQRQGAARIDVSRYNKGNPAMPGTYRADLYVNQTWLGRAEIVLRQSGAGAARPCFEQKLLERIGVDLSKLSEPALALLKDGECAPLPRLIPEAVATFDNGELRLDVGIPQAALSRKPRGYVDPSNWDEGVPAALLQYNASAFRSRSQGVVSTQAFVGLTAGVNIGAWRFRHHGSLVHSSGSGLGRDPWRFQAPAQGTGTGTRYQSMQSYAQRGVASIKSQLTVGDAFTDGAMFDSVGFRGVRLASDDRMYPDSQRGYAPTVRGIANSNAAVQIRQNGNVIYETNVAAGPFEINDLYPTGYGGDLEVIVTEADGSKRTSKLPYAAAVNALRPGITRYSVTAGQFRDAQLPSTPALFQATVQHGLTNMLTGYGGMVATRDYWAGVVGAAVNTEWGAFGLDLTHSTAQMKEIARRQGQSVRLSYSKLIDPTNTNISVAAYRYSSSGYLSLRDALALRDQGTRGRGESFGWPTGIQRSQLQLTINQSLPQGYGTVYLSGSTRNYWDRAGRETQFQAGYNNSWGKINYGISVSRQYDLVQRRWDNRVMFTVGLPLGDGAHTPYASTTVQRESHGATSVQQSVSGTLGEDNAFNYGVNVGHASGGAAQSSTNTGANIAWTSPAAVLLLNASQGRGYSQVGAGISGGIVGYEGGVAFTPSMGDTLAIVEAENARGARVANNAGLRIDPWGHAVVSNLTPFSSNEVEIDPKGLPLSVELKTTSLRTAPTAGAVVKLKFEVEGGGRAAMLRVKLADGQPLPFGADVLDAAGQNVGTVAQAGRIFVRGLKSDSGVLGVKWGEGGTEHCTLAYVLPPSTDASVSALTTVEATCQK